MTVGIRFEDVIDKMPVLLCDLRKGSALSRNSLGVLPKEGVYVFYENGAPLYVGRSSRLRQRLLEHSRPSSVHNSATFAFLLALEKAKSHEKQWEKMKTKTRGQLEKNDWFKAIYLKAKERVSDMDIKVVEVKDAIEQTVFEVYAALKLNTPYNTFENH